MVLREFFVGVRTCDISLLSSPEISPEIKTTIEFLFLFLEKFVGIRQTVLKNVGVKTNKTKICEFYKKLRSKTAMVHRQRTPLPNPENIKLMDQKVQINRGRVWIHLRLNFFYCVESAMAR